jgi:2-C-methyl-D-erythritol 4-phosphate cytidylyltransferase/2-C-methyl-D-erythritol 2,4-cyclodiphosphate synthase
MELSGKPLLAHTVSVLEQVPEIDAIIVVVPAGQEDLTTQDCLMPYGLDLNCRVVSGGAERQDSVRNGLLKARELGAEYVLVHDGARPLATPSLFEKVYAATIEHGAAIAAVPCFDTVKKAKDNNLVDSTLDRSNLWLVQTPQGFELGSLLETIQRACERGFYATDEAGLLEWAGKEVKLVPGERDNFKITTPEDLRLAQFLKGGPSLTRTGQGMDVHRLVKGRKLVLGGVCVDHELGLLGHSDADVLTHAIMDALLAAAGLGDIGRWFPDNDPAFKDACSLELLARVCGELARNGWRPLQISATLMAQKPKISPYVDEMRQNLASAAGLGVKEINVAATTTEGLGFVGRQEGMAAMATAVIQKIDHA